MREVGRGAAIGLAGLAVGVGGTLGVQAVVDDSGSTSSGSDQRAIDRAY